MLMGFVLFGLTAGPAKAGVVTLQGSTLGFAEFSDEPNRPINVAFSQSGNVVTISSLGDVLSYVPPAPCTYLGSNFDVVECDLTGIDFLSAVGGPGDDQVTVESSLPAIVCGGNGDDVLTGGAGDDLMGGAAGNDSLSGGRGNDVLQADRFEHPAYPLCAETPGSPPGKNTLEGGPGNDYLVGGGGEDYVDGEGGRGQARRRTQRGRRRDPGRRTRCATVLWARAGLRDSRPARSRAERQRPLRADRRRNPEKAASGSGPRRPEAVRRASGATGRP